MAKTTSAKPQKSFEQNLWDTADKLRGTVESSEYKHVVLSLIFLKFVSDKFAAHNCPLALSTLRDTLLPKLLSGQLRIPEAEQLAANAL